MPTPLVSILIPCHNAAPWLAETLRSALAQTHPQIEIILVDDGSTDGSVEIARSFASDKIKIIAQDNSGQSAAFNRALSEAKGDYIEYLDADDILDRDKIAHQIKALEQCEAGWIASGAWARFSTNPAEARFETEAIWQDLLPVDWLVSSWSGGGMMHGAAWLVPRTVAMQAGPWNEDLSLVNDFDYFCRVVLQSRGVKFCRNARTYYRSNLPGSLSAQKNRNAWQSAFDSFSRGTTVLLARENSPRTRLAAAITFQSFAFGAYPTASDLVQLAEHRVNQLGGCDRKLRSGRIFNFIASTLGWKAARQIQIYFHRHLLRRSS